MFVAIAGQSRWYGYGWYHTNRAGVALAIVAGYVFFSVEALMVSPLMVNTDICDCF